MIFVSRTVMPVSIQKVIINQRYGGFGFSRKAMMEYLKRTGQSRTLPEDEHDYGSCALREDPVMIQIVEEFGSKECSGRYSRLVVQNGVKGYISIHEYDGLEELSVSSHPKVDVRKVVFDDTLSSDEKLARLREAFEEVDAAQALWKSFPENQPQSSVKSDRQLMGHNPVEDCDPSIGYDL